MTRGSASRSYVVHVGPVTLSKAFFPHSSKLMRILTRSGKINFPRSSKLMRILTRSGKTEN